MTLYNYALSKLINPLRLRILILENLYDNPNISLIHEIKFWASTGWTKIKGTTKFVKVS